MNILDKIKSEEGDIAKMYKCPAGKWTIGAGINLEAQEMPQQVRDLWLELITRDYRTEISFRLLEDYGTSLSNLPPNVIIVLQDMAHHMGVNGLFNFVNMIKAICSEYYIEAAEHLLDSRYASQTPERANRNADLLRGCA
jgi:lysozyme